ncbi:hypothetical protein P3G55_08805 [Leptospira sp. 96542]|nr:hypothetical protein [Leptospira sp. 96542]
MKILHCLFLVTGIGLFSQCVSSPNYGGGAGNYHYDQRYRNFQHSPRNYQNPENYYRYRSNQFLRSPDSTGGSHNHNPFHVPAGRYQNLNKPGKWRL